MPLSGEPPRQLTWTKEQRLLALAARLAPDPETDDELRRLTEIIDWHVVVELAGRTGTAPLLHRALARAEVTGPERLRHTLLAAHAVAAIRSEQVMEEVLQVSEILGRHGIPVLPLKGAALMATLYPEPGLRTVSDIDLLVPPRDAREAARLLVDAGYWTLQEGLLLDRSHRFHHHVTLSRQTTPVPLTLELHHRLLMSFSRRLDSDAVFRRAQQVPYGEGTTLALDPADQLVYLGGHLALHLGDPHLKWLADLQALLATATAGAACSARQAGIPGSARRTAPATAGSARRTGPAAAGSARRTAPATAAGSARRTAPATAAGSARRTAPATAPPTSRVAADLNLDVAVERAAAAGVTTALYEALRRVGLVLGTRELPPGLLDRLRPPRPVATALHHLAPPRLAFGGPRPSKWAMHALGLLIHQGVRDRAAFAGMSVGYKLWLERDRLATGIDTLHARVTGRFAPGHDAPPDDGDDPGDAACPDDGDERGEADDGDRDDPAAETADQADAADTAKTADQTGAANHADSSDHAAAAAADTLGKT